MTLVDQVPPTPEYPQGYLLIKDVKDEDAAVLRLCDMEHKEELDVKTVAWPYYQAWTKKRGISYAKVSVPANCKLYMVKTKSPKGLGRFDRHISAHSPKEAKDIWKSLYSHMFGIVKITGIEELPDCHGVYFDRSHCDITGILDVHPEEF